MSRSSRKFIAVLMLLWLPIFTGSALAASVSMQLPQGGCHEMDKSHESMDMGEHQMLHGEMSSPAGEHDPSCNACGVCHLACTGYFAIPGVITVSVQAVARENTPYLVAFHSVTSVPLLPPPLVRA